MKPDAASPMPFRSVREGELFTTEGGTETEIMFKCGFELPQFAMYPLLDDPEAVDVLDGMYRRYLAVAERHGLSVLLGGLDYRASPDWGSLIGYSAEGLADMQHRSIGFLRDMAAKHGDGVPRILIGGLIGPRGDAYELNRTITAAEAEDYHAIQLGTLRAAEVDFACAMTFNNVEEAIGVVRAARAAGVLDSGQARQARQGLSAAPGATRRRAHPPPCRTTAHRAPPRSASARSVPARAYDRCAHCPRCCP